jgi:hypothetical protein
MGEQDRTRRLLFLILLLCVVLGACFAYRFISARQRNLLRERREAFYQSDLAPPRPSQDQIRGTAESLALLGVELCLHGKPTDIAEFGINEPFREARISDVAQVTPEVIKLLQQLPDLSSLSCYDIPLADDHVKLLSELDQVSRLNLNYTEITDGGLMQLTKMQQLESLMLNGTRITDAGLAHVANMKSLHELLLYDTEIGDEGLTHLESLRLLKTLDVQETGVTPEAVTRLQKSAPNCKVAVDPY